MKRSVLHAVLEARARKRPLVLVTELGSGLQWAEIQGETGSGLQRAEVQGETGSGLQWAEVQGKTGSGPRRAEVPGEPAPGLQRTEAEVEPAPGPGPRRAGVQGEPAPDLDAEVREAARAALARDRSAVVEVAGTSYFLHAMNPPLRLFVVGAVHIAQALVPMASLLGYAVTVIDPRRAFLTAERFPGVTVTTEWPDDALTAAELDVRSAVVTLTHDPKLDDPALRVALASPAFYIGSLGSRRTHARRIERLTGAGQSADALARIHAPIGLDIGAVSAAEIAASIVAELTSVLRARTRA